MRDIDDLLNHVPDLVKAYGKWPRFAYVVFATAMAHRRRIAIGGSIVALGLLKILH